MRRGLRKKPPRVVQIPNVLGLSLDEAKAVLSQRGLEIGNISYVLSEYEEGIVVEQAGTEGNYTKEGYAVDLTVSIAEEYTGE